MSPKHEPSRPEADLVSSFLPEPPVVPPSPRPPVHPPEPGCATLPVTHTPRLPSLPGGIGLPRFK